MEHVETFEEFSDRHINAIAGAYGVPVDTLTKPLDDAHIEYGFLEGEKPRTTKTQCAMLNMRRAYAAKHKLIKQRGYEAPRPRYKVTIAPFVVRMNFDDTPYLRQIYDALNDSDASNEVVIMKGATAHSSSPTINNSTAFILHHMQGLPKGIDESDADYITRVKQHFNL